MGVVVNKRRKTMAEDAALQFVKQSTEFYRLIIPSNQLGVMAKLAPDLDVLEIQGLGTTEKLNVSSEFEWGRFQFGSSGRVMLDWVYDVQTGPAKLSAIYKKCTDLNFPDVSIARLVYLKRLSKLTKMDTRYNNMEIPSHVRLVFKSESVHPMTYAKIMADGVLPMAEMYATLRKFKAAMELPKEMKARIKPNYLKLLGFYPSTANVLLTDFDVVTSFRESGMFIVQEISKTTKVKDLTLGR